MSEVCSCCDSVVYSAEKAAISGKKGDVYHKKCMKCCVCSKRLDSITFNEHDGNVFIYIYIYILVYYKYNIVALCKSSTQLVERI